MSVSGNKLPVHFQSLFSCSCIATQASMGAVVFQTSTLWPCLHLVVRSALFDQITSGWWTHIQIFTQNLSPVYNVNSVRDLTRKRRNCWIKSLFFFSQKVFSSLHII